MNQTVDYNILRRQLDRWYAGLTTPEEESALIDLFAEARDLPADLEADRDLMLAMRASKEEKLALPQEFQRSISAAFEAEMAGAEPEAIGLRRAPLMLRRRAIWWSVAACVAILLGCSLFGPVFHQNEPDLREVTASAQPAPGADHLVDPVESRKIMEYDTVTMVNLTAEALPAPAKRNNSRKERHTASTQKIASRAAEAENFVDIPPVADEGAMSENIENLPYTPEMDDKLAKYHVVEDEEEANLIINSIFSRMQANVEMETHKLSKSAVEYDFVITKLNKIDNLGTLRAFYYDRKESI